MLFGSSLLGRCHCVASRQWAMMRIEDWASTWSSTLSTAASFVYPLERGEAAGPPVDQVIGEPATVDSHGTGHSVRGPPSTVGANK